MAVNQERVNVVCNELANAGKKPTLAAVRDAMGEGSYSTIGPMIQKWKAGRGEIAGGDVVAVSVPDALQSAGGRMLAEVWALAERLAAERLTAERAAMDVEREGMAAELEAAYSEMEGLREQLAKSEECLRTVSMAHDSLENKLTQAREEAQGLKVDLSAAKAEAGAFKLAIEKINPKVNQEQPKKPAPGKKGGRAIGKSNSEPVDTKTAPLAL